MENPVDIFCKRLLNDRRFLNKAYRMYWKKCEELTFPCDSYVSADVLTEVLIKAKRSKRIRMLLPAIMWYVNGDSINNYNFELIISYSNRIRNLIFHPLEHADDLSFYQLMVMNTYKEAGGETLGQLIWTICKYDCFTENDMINVLDNSALDFSDIARLINDAEEVLKPYTKYLVAKEWVLSKLV